MSFVGRPPGLSDGIRVRDCPYCFGLGTLPPGPRYGILCDHCGGTGQVVTSLQAHPLETPIGAGCLPSPPTYPNPHSRPHPPVQPGVAPAATQPQGEGSYPGNGSGCGDVLQKDCP